MLRPFSCGAEHTVWRGGAVIRDAARWGSSSTPHSLFSGEPLHQDTVTAKPETLNSHAADHILNAQRSMGKRRVFQQTERKTSMA